MKKGKRKRGVRDTSAYPMPEAIDGERWRVSRSPSLRVAGVSPWDHQMIVPLGQEEPERLVRLHEMTHIKITPKTIRELAGIEDLPEEIVQTCEDSRVHGQMQRLGFGIRNMVGVIPDIEMNSIGKEAHLAVLAGIAAATYGTGEHERLTNAIPDFHEEGIDERQAAFMFGAALADARAHDPVELPGFDVTLQMVREIVDMYGDPRDPDPPPPPIIPPNRQHQIPNADPHGTAGWGEMTLEEPKLPLRLPGHLKGKRKKVPEVRGRRLHRIGRLYQDGRVFATRTPVRRGGAVLIDTSGSMALEPSEVLELCLKYPAGVIGAYSGTGEDSGTLRVIARNGKRVRDEDMDPPGGGNVVDGPALDWLAQQPGPRWWISDAGVSGGAVGLKYCYDVCKRNNIIRVDDAWTILDK